jgi:5-methyltetrahydropteroyltriglutamate--homocysteine methyltransferase
MMPTDKPPFRADHVGSLLRPKKLLQAREDKKAGKIGAEALRQTEDEAIRDVVKLQEEVGLKSVTDGEFRRLDWLMDFKFQLGGVTVHEGKTLNVPFETEEGTVNWSFTKYVVDGRIKLDHVIYGDDFDFLKKTTKQTAKICIPSPSMMHYPAGRGVDRKVYPDLAVFLDDLAKAYGDEIEALGKRGCTYLQLDDTSLAFLNSPERRAQIGPDGETDHLRYIECMNKAIARKPAGMAITTHMCRGNFKSAWSAQSASGYDHVAEALFGALNVDGYFMEFDDERSGGFAPLRFLTKGKKIVLGLVTSKKATLESKDMLKRRIDEAAKYVPLEQLCISPQCGFSSTLEGNNLTLEEEKAKLRLCVEVAEEVWGSA